MKKERDPTQEEFANLLNWLAADRDTAGRKYESIRAGLVKIFVSRGCVDAEDLADEVIDRVAIGLNKIIGRYEGDPATYFYGFVHYVYLEYSRKNSWIVHDMADTYLAALLQKACFRRNSIKANLNLG